VAFLLKRRAPEKNKEEEMNYWVMNITYKNTVREKENKNDAYRPFRQRKKAKEKASPPDQ
jgi:hypothetical protein